MTDVRALPSDSTRSFEQQEIESSSQNGDRQQPSLSVIIPTYNERENVQHVVDRSLDALAEYTVEILVVDDDSPDGTWRLAREAYQGDDRVRVLRRMDETGLATAVALGFREAAHDICVVIDADLQHPPERIPELITSFTDEVDLVVGSRMHEDGAIEDWSPFRSLTSATAARLTELFVPQSRRVTDPMSGFFAVRRSCLTGVDLDPLGYKILLEILVRADIDRVVEVPYTFHERKRGDSKLTPRQYVRFVEHNVKLGLESRNLCQVGESKRFGRTLERSVIGALAVVVNVAVFALALTAGVFYLLAGLLAFLATVNTTITGSKLLTFVGPEKSILRQHPRLHAFLSGSIVVYLTTLVVLIELLSVPLIAANLVALVGSSTWSGIGKRPFVGGGIR